MTTSAQLTRLYDRLSNNVASVQSSTTCERDRDFSMVSVPRLALASAVTGKLRKTVSSDLVAMCESLLVVAGDIEFQITKDENEGKACECCQCGER